MDQISGQFITSGTLIGAALIYWLFVLITLYHLDRFGSGSQPRRIALLYLIGSAGFFVCFALLMSQLNVEALRPLLQVGSQEFNFNFIRL